VEAWGERHTRKIYGDLETLYTKKNETEVWKLEGNGFFSASRVREKRNQAEQENQVQHYQVEQDHEEAPTSPRPYRDY